MSGRFEERRIEEMQLRRTADWGDSEALRHLPFSATHNSCGNLNQAVKNARGTSTIRRADLPL
jgi:hypothetical protein